MSELSTRQFSPVFIDEKNYIQSLLDAAEKDGFLFAEAREMIENELSLFLMNSVYMFKKTGFASESEEKIEQIANAALYFVSIPLKAMKPQDSLKKIFELNFMPLMEEGKETAKKRFLHAYSLFAKLRNNSFPTDNIFLIDLIKNIIPKFFYAHQSIITDERNIVTLYDCESDFDFAYPVMKFSENAPGIEKVDSYITALYCENNFLKHFQPELVQAITKDNNLPQINDSIYSNFSFNCVNIFENVFYISLKLILCNKNPLTLNFSVDDKQYLNLLFKGKNKNEINAYYHKALNKLFENSSFTTEERIYYNSIIQ